MQSSVPLAGRADPALIRFGSPRVPHWLTRLALPGVLGLATLNFSWQLGSSSYFVDEVQSLSVAAQPIGDLLRAIDMTEITPPAYFFFLHEWLYRLSTQAEWVARLPSALCGVLLVAAVYWLASLVCDRRAVALGAAGIAALSPFVLEYAQRAQGYGFEMLFATLAVAAALRAERAGPRRGRWLAVAAAASALALCLHYTAGLAIGALCVWVATRATLPRRWRAGFLGSCLLVELALIPLLLAQHEAIPQRAGVAASAGVSWANVARMLETPFDGRAAALPLLGVAVTTAALLALIAARRRVLHAQGLLLILAAGAPLVLLAGSAFGAKLMLTRYAAVSAPFAIVAIAAAVVSSHRSVGALLAAGAVAVTLSGVLASHRVQGFYLDARGVMSYLRAHDLQRDAVLAPQAPAIAVPLIHYGLARLPWIREAQAAAIVGAHTRRLWEIVELRSNSSSAADVLRLARRDLVGFGYRALSARIFPGVVPLAVLLDAPLGKRDKSR